jgi:hypothetical protein
MSPQCIESVNQAAGRVLTPTQLQAIEDRISGTARRLAGADPQRWRTLSPEARTLEAAQQAMKDIAHEAARKVENAQRQILKTAETHARIDRLAQVNESGRNAALVADIENSQKYIHGLRDEAVSGLVDLLEAGRSGSGAGLGRKALMVLFDAENPLMSRDLAVEIFTGAKGSTGNTIAQKGAQAWLDTIEGMRQRFNAAGGDIRKLDYGYLPQPHDAGRVLDAGRDAWAAKIMPLLDRGRYLKEDGSRMNDTELADMLRRVWETLATEGRNKMTPGEFKGTGSRSNRGNDSREIHFKDADSYLAYMRDFGEGSMYDAMLAHISGVARDIGLVERYGPNPEQQMRVQMDAAVMADNGSKRVFGLHPQSYWNILNGTTGTPKTPVVAQIGNAARALQTAAKLGGAVVSSVTDVATYFTTAGYNRLSYWEALTNIGRQTSGETREFLTMHGVIADSLLSDMNRWAGDNVSRNLTGRLANSTMKLSLMNVWTDSLRNAFQMTMMSGLAKLSRTDWKALSEYDRVRLERHGITPDDWAVLQQAKLEQHRGMDFLTPEAVRDGDIALARPADIQRVRDAVAAQTQDLQARNAQEQAWIKGRIEKFDAARDALNRSVKRGLDKHLARNEKATEPLLQRMALLDAQREAAQLQGALEADFNKLATQDEVRAFLNAVEDGASADLVDVQQAKPALREGLQAAEAAGRRYGVEKGRLQQRMRELEQRITAMDVQAYRDANKAGKEAMAKADEMAAELRDFIQRSQDRQARRQAVIDRIQGEEAARVAAEAERIKGEVVAKLLGVIKDEGEYAVINPDMATRGWQTWGGLQAGTASGELARTVMQFKSFPFAMISRHWRRMMDAPQVDGAPAAANRLVYGMGLAVSLTLLGAVAFQTKQILAGKDPVAMDTPKFWTRAFSQGGGLGIVGDLLLTDTTQDRSPLDTLGRITMGPTFGTAADLFDLTKGNIDEALAGKDTHAAAEALRFVKAHAPVINLWYTRAAIDHIGLQQVQENLSPGYLARMRARAMKEWGQDYWWAPGDGLPERAPNLGAMGGR